MAASALMAASLGSTPAYAANGEPFSAATCADYQRNSPIESWAANRLKVSEVAPLATGKGVTIAIIDTGVDTEIPVLTKQGKPVITQSYNFTGYERTTGRTDCSHGTRVASLIVGRGDNLKGTNFRGLAPDANVIAMRTLQAAVQLEQGQANRPEPLEPTIKAIRKAIELDVDIINISQQGTDDPEYRRAVAEAVAAGIVVVASAGNQGGAANPPFPASYPGVIAVGMSDINDRADPHSQHHRSLNVSVAAPGVDVLMANPSGPSGQSWEAATGTSYAAPQVAATVALMLELEPDLKPSQVKERLEASADPPASTAPDRQLGHGIVNPYRALTDVAPARSGGSQAPTAGRAPNRLREPRETALAGQAAVLVSMVSVGAMAVAVATAVAVAALRRRDESKHP